MIWRGDVVIVDVPYTDTPGAKARPAIIVQNDRDNQRLRKTVSIVITGNLKRLGDPSHFLIDPNTPEGASAGIRGPSVASCNNIFTVEQNKIRQVVGHLSDVLKQRLNDCLKAALEIA
jgi:mRNA interferase MazF